VFALKVTQFCSLTTFFTMSTDLMVAALRRGQNGNEILAILDAITSGDNDAPSTQSAVAQPTLEPVEF
jgi:hypothetical protein